VEPPLLVLDPASALPPYEQIATQVRRQVAAGRLLPGAPLPSVRQLAGDLGVAPNTVVRAYAELERGGWIVARLRRGFAVSERRPPEANGERARQLAGAVRDLLVTCHQLGAGAAEVHAEIDRQMREVGSGRGAR